jgi:NTF2 fold immunity protein
MSKKNSIVAIGLVIAFLAAFLLLRSNELEVGIAHVAKSDCTIFRIAERYIAIHYPDFDSIESSPMLYDAGTNWRVWYTLPKGAIGGTPVLEINKQTLEVISAQHSQ